MDRMVKLCLFTSIIGLIAVGTHTHKSSHEESTPPAVTSVDSRGTFLKSCEVRKERVITRCKNLMQLNCRKKGDEFYEMCIKESDNE